MFHGGLGLTEVNSHDLQKALRALYRNELELPVTIAGLARVGLQHCAQPLLAQLRDLDDAGTRAVLVSVLAERKRHKQFD